MQYAFLDLFCGAGGTSTGINNSSLRAKKRAFVFACVNHDKNAILSHAENHPECLHFTEDIRTVGLRPIVARVKEIRAKFPNIKICLWASLECTNHSNAKGGMSRDADSRTLAEHLFRYFVIDFDLIFIENVREFKQWGPLIHKITAGVPQYCNKQKPIMIPDKTQMGTDYKKWVNEVCTRGYHYEDTLLNCADYGCPTTRKRLFIQFAKQGTKIAWPTPTHTKEDWLPVLPHIDFSEEGKSIFYRDKPLSDKTLARIKRGLVKFEGEKFLQKYYSTGENVCSLNEPSPTITTKDRMSIVNPFILTTTINKSLNSVNEPCSSITTNPQQRLVSAFLTDTQFGNEGSSLSKPCPTLIARQDKKPKYLISSFITSHYSPGTNRSVKEPCPTLTTVPHETISFAKFNPEPLKITRKDSVTMKDMKSYCNEKGIGDITMRSLNVKELLSISTFPRDYKFVGTQTEAKKFIGNAVPPKIVTEMIKQSWITNYKNQ